eukprot:Clim_evm42s202 gene=Clim_evmTU42s202
MAFASPIRSHPAPEPFPARPGVLNYEDLAADSIIEAQTKRELQEQFARVTGHLTDEATPLPPVQPTPAPADFHSSSGIQPRHNFPTPAAPPRRPAEQHSPAASMGLAFGSSVTDSAFVHVNEVERGLDGSRGPQSHRSLQASSPPEPIQTESSTAPPPVTSTVVRRTYKTKTDPRSGSSAIEFSVERHAPGVMVPPVPEPQPKPTPVPNSPPRTVTKGPMTEEPPRIVPAPMPRRPVVQSMKFLLEKMRSLQQAQEYHRARAGGDSTEFIEGVTQVIGTRATDGTANVNNTTTMGALSMTDLQPNTTTIAATGVSSPRRRAKKSSRYSNLVSLQDFELSTNMASSSASHKSHNHTISYAQNVDMTVHSDVNKSKTIPLNNTLPGDDTNNLYMPRPSKRQVMANAVAMKGRRKAAVRYARRYEASQPAPKINDVAAQDLESLNWVPHAKGSPYSLLSAVQASRHNASMPSSKRTGALARPKCPPPAGLEAYPASLKDLQVPPQPISGAEALWGHSAQALRERTVHELDKTRRRGADSLGGPQTQPHVTPAMRDGCTFAFHEYQRIQGMQYV